MATIRPKKEEEEKGPRLLRVPGDFSSPQDAIDAAAEGDCVFLAPHEFTITEPLRIVKPIHVMGEDESGSRATVTFNGASLRPNLPLIRIASSCRLQGVVFNFTCDGEKAAEAAKATAYAMHITEGDVLLTNVRIQSQCCGVLIGPNSYSSMSAVSLEVAFVSVRVQGKAFLERCSVQDGLMGVKVENSCTLSCNRTRISNCSVGVDIGPHANATVSACTIDNCATGIIVSDDTPSPKPPRITGNKILVCTTGIYTKGEGCTCDITKNLVEECKVAGVVIDGGMSFLTSNAVKQCGAAGIAVFQGKPQLSCNVIQGSAEAGVSVVGQNALPVVTSNEIMKCQVGVAVQDSAAPTIESNTFSSNKKNIEVENALGLYSKNELLPSEEESIVVGQPSSSVVIEENEILGSISSCGICIADGARAIVASNIISGSKLSGIVLKACGSTEVKGNELDPETCQAGALVAQRQAIAKVHHNYTHGLEVTVYSDSTETTMVSDNIE